MRTSGARDKRKFQPKPGLGPYWWRNWGPKPGLGQRQTGMQGRSQGQGTPTPTRRVGAPWGRIESVCFWLLVGMALVIFGAWLVAVTTEHWPTTPSVSPSVPAEESQANDHGLKTSSASNGERLGLQGCWWSNGGRTMADGWVIQWKGGGCLHRLPNPTTPTPRGAPPARGPRPPGPPIRPVHLSPSYSAHKVTRIRFSKQL